MFTQYTVKTDEDKPQVFYSGFDVDRANTIFDDTNIKDKKLLLMKRVISDYELLESKQFSLALSKER